MECADNAPTRKAARNCGTNYASRVADCRPTRNKMERARPNKERVPKIIYKWKPYATRPKGRPRLRWEDDVRNDMGSMGVKNWKQKVQERKQWKEIIEQAKTHKEL